MRVCICGSFFGFCLSHISIFASLDRIGVALALFPIHDIRATFDDLRPAIERMEIRHPHSAGPQIKTDQPTEKPFFAKAVAQIGDNELVGVLRAWGQPEIGLIEPADASGDRFLIGDRADDGVFMMIDFFFLILSFLL
jgi:hypothetical protein